MKHTYVTPEPTRVDVKWVQTHYMLKTGLQSKLRKAGLLPYYIVPGTTKILYDLSDIDTLIARGKVL